MSVQRLSLFVCIAVGLSSPVYAQKLDAEQIGQSVRYITDLQGVDGGFRPAMTSNESDLGATTASLRALRYLHSKARPRNGQAVKDFVLKCYVPATGSLALKPGGESDVRSTATGLMSLA